MLRVLEVTLPVFALVFCGFFGQRWHLLPARAVQGINAFVFFFALPAMLFRVVATQKPASFSDGRFALGYAVATVAVFLFTRSAALPPRTGWRDDDPQARAAAGSQATAFGLNTAHGNIGYLGIPLVLELGRDYLPTLILAMICDIFLVITLGIALLELDRRRGRPAVQGERRVSVTKTVALGLARSPLVVAIALGLLWALWAQPLPGVLDNFSRILGAAAGPCALFAIGASLAGRRPDRPLIAAWLSFAKLVLHPAAVAIAALWLFPVEPYAAGVMIAAAALPVAGNVFILAQHYGVAPQRVSTAILISTALSVLTVTAVIALLETT